MKDYSRREVVRMFGVAGIAAAFLPERVWAERVAQDKVILGDGAYRYEWVKSWLKLPENVKLGSTHGCVAVDSKDNIYFNTDGEHPIIIVTADGKYVKSFGKDFRGGAHGMTIAKEGDKEVIWLTSLSRKEAIKVSLEGEVQMAIPYPEKSGVYKEKKEYAPTAVAVAPNGDVYVGDGYGKHWVHQWNAKGEYVRSWNGEKGKAGPFRTPHGIAVDTRGAEPLVIVADRANGRLQYFKLDGEYVDVLTGFRNPCKVVVRGDDIVVPDLQGRVTIVNKENKIALHLGEADPQWRGKFATPADKFEDGKFTAPHGAAFDSKGNIYVEDWNQTGRVSKLQKLA
jgi:hypothetical protein